MGEQTIRRASLTRICPTHIAGMGGSSQAPYALRDCSSGAANRRQRARGGHSHVWRSDGARAEAPPVMPRTVEQLSGALLADPVSIRLRTS